MKKLKGLISVLFLAMTFAGPAFSPLADEITELENSKARLLIENYEIVDGEILPGNEIAVKLTVHNTNKVSVAQNVILSVVNNQGIAVPVAGKSNQIAVGDIMGGASVEVEVPFRVIEQVKNEQNITLLFYMTFSDGRATEVTNEAYISIPIEKEYDAEIVHLSLKDGCYVNEKAIVSSEIKNNSAIAVSDMKLHVVQENGTETEYLLGDIGSGVTMYYDHTIEMLNPGEQELLAFLSYQDAEGVEYTTQETIYPVRVLEDNPEKQVLQNTGTKNVDRTFLVMNAALIGVALVIILVSHKRGTRRINSGKEVGDGKRS